MPRGQRGGERYPPRAGGAGLLLGNTGEWCGNVGETERQGAGVFLGWEALAFESLRALPPSPPQPCGRPLSSILGRSNLKFAGMPITLTVSTSSLNLMAADCKQVGGLWQGGQKLLEGPSRTLTAPGAGTGGLGRRGLRGPGLRSQKGGTGCQGSGWWWWGGSQVGPEAA